MRRATTLLAALALGLLARVADGAAVVPQAIANRPSSIVNGVDAITIPRMLSYQGKLTDTFGLPLADTVYAVRFRLYFQPTGGTHFWEENRQVRTQGGLFSVLLGSVTPIDDVPEDGSLYLGMAVNGGSELTPRLRIASAVYTYMSERSAQADLAADADRLQGRDTTAFVRAGQTNSVSSAMIVNGTVAAADLGQMGAASGQVMKWTGSAWAPRNDSVGGGGGGGTVTSVSQATGVVCTPNPITSTGTVGFDQTWGDSRYVNEAQANSVTSAMIQDGQVRGADVALPCTLSSSSAGQVVLVNVTGNGAGITVTRNATASTNPTIVAVNSGSGAGVLGQASESPSAGILGRHYAGGPAVFGAAGSAVPTPQVSAGVAAYSLDGPGIYVSSAGTDGLRIARAGADCIRVDSAGDDGIEISNCPYGVYAHDATHTGVIGGGKWGGSFYTNTEANGVGLFADAYNQNAADTAIMAQGKGLATGGWYTGFDDGEAPSIVSDERTIVATGRARIVQGKATATFPVLFRAHLRHGAPVRVSLTPRGDPAGVLYVAASDAVGFSVRLKTVPGWDGAEDVEFDWVAFGTLEEPQTSPADRAAWDAPRSKRPSPGSTAPPPPQGHLSPSETGGQRMSDKQE